MACHYTESRAVTIYRPAQESVKELQAMGVTFDLLIPYLMTVNEKAVTENIDLKTAAYKPGQEPQRLGYAVTIISSPMTMTRALKHMTLS
jgi:hypothetical protein